MTRTSPPVTTMPTSATRFASRIGGQPAGAVAGRAAGAAGEVVLVLVTAQGYGGTDGARAPAGQSPQRKNRRARAPPTRPHATSTAHCAHGQPPSTNGGAHRVAQRTEGSSAATVAERPGQQVGGEQHPEPEQQHPDEVGDGQHGLGAQGAGEQQGQRHEGRRCPAGASTSTAGCRRPPAARPSASPSAPSTTTCTREHREHGQALGGEQPAAARAGWCRAAQHAGAAVEAGRDGLPGERGGDDGQGQGPGRGDVDAGAGPEVGHRGQRSARPGPARAAPARRAAARRCASRIRVSNEAAREHPLRGPALRAGARPGPARSRGAPAVRRSRRPRGSARRAPRRACRRPRPARRP